MTWRSRIAVLIVVALGACSDRGPSGALSISHPDHSSARVEYFIRQPQGAGPWPTIVFLHGHQNIWSRPGGRQFVEWGVLDKYAARGYLAVSVSLPGYGNTDGPSDFAGPNTQHAVSAVIAKLKAEGKALDHKVLIQGISLGAVTAALIATQDPKIAGLVLISGLYDFTQFMQKPSSIQAQLVKYFFLAQTDGSPEALRLRSALNFTETIKAATLILNGAKDDRTDPDQAVLLAERIKVNGVRATAHIFPDHGHEIPVSVREAQVDAFMTEVLAP
jgi:dipeptidyl aminopeptidase/acylaminoacyl peptidase